MLQAEVDDVRSSATFGRVRVVPAGDPSITASSSEVVAALGPLVRGWVHGHHEGIGSWVPRAAAARTLRALADALLGAADPVVAHVEDAVWQALFPEPFGAVGTPAAPLPRLGRDRLLLVIGCARSGTTWLENLLTSHPLAGGPETGETFLFHDLRVADAALTRAGLDSAAMLRTACDELFAAGVADHGFFVEKTPLHSLDLELIARIYPDAYVIHLVRDGRDVARSLAEVTIFDETGVQMDVRRGAALWRHVLTDVRANASRFERFRELRYEDLVADPTGLTTSLLEWVGLDVSEDVRRTISSRAAREVSAHGSTGAVGAGKWKTLSARDLRAVYEEAGSLLVAEGYASATELAATGRHGLRGLLGKVVR